MGRVTEETITKVTKVTRITTKETPGVTKVLVGVIRGKYNPPQGGPTHLPIQRDQIIVRMIIMLTHLTCRSYLTLYRSFRMTTQSQRLFTMNICMTSLLSLLTTKTLLFWCMIRIKRANLAYDALRARQCWTPPIIRRILFLLR